MITWKLADDSGLRVPRRQHQAARRARRSAASRRRRRRRGTRRCQFQNTNGKQYKARNKNDVAATLSYDITVYHKATGAPYTLDPVIFNDP